MRNEQRVAVWKKESIPLRSIYTVKADGSELRRITNPQGEDSDFFPSWSPDGRRISFTRNTGGNVDVYTMGRAGGNTPD
jgi:TolB protein